MPSLLAKASGKMTLDDGKELFEETDTHFGCDDGIAACLRCDRVTCAEATLNWRLVFNVPWPVACETLGLR